MKPLRLSHVLSILSLMVVFAGCNLFKSATPKDKEQTVVGKVNDTDVTYAELRSSFYTSPLQEDADPEATKQEFIEFLDLYLVYLAKIEAAKDRGYYQDEEILAELTQYQMQSVFPYWLEMRFRDQLLDELVERSKTEIGASHVLIAVAEDASPGDTLAAWNTLVQARDAFLSNQDERSFNDLAEEYSTSQRGQSMGGDLGYISGGWAVKPFEDVAYSIEPGDVSMPFRTSFGYHIIHVYDKRDAQPEKNYSHMYFRTRGQGSSLEQAAEKAQLAWSELNEGGYWAEVTEEYSEDPDTRAKGGDIGWVQPSRYQPMFIENINTLSSPGNWTEPFESEYGMHIVRLDSIKTYASKEELREEKYTILKNLPRYRENKAFTLENVRRAGNDTLFTSTFDLFIDQHDSSPGLTVAELGFTPEELALPLYEINNRTFNLEDFIGFVINSVASSNDMRYRHRLLNEYKDKKTESVIIEITKAEFPEFAELSKRYHEGLAVFKLTEKEVWNYASQDTSRLKDIFEANPDNYRYDTRYRYYRLSADHESTLEEARAAIKEGTVMDDIREVVSGLILRTDVINSLQDFPFDHLDGLQQGEFSELFEYRNRNTILYLEEILEPRNMTFEEAFMRLVADFQPIRDAEWNTELRNTYRVEAYHERLEALLQEIEL